MNENHSNHSNFLSQALMRKKERDKEVSHRGACLKPFTVATVDTRLKSESFRTDVRLVMDYLGIENTGRNFKEWDKTLEWTTFANNIRNPHKTAWVEPLWYGHPIGATITIDLPGRTQAEALKKLDKSKYLFREWSW